MPSSKGSSQSRDSNYVSYVCLLHWQAVSLPLTPALGSLYVCMHVYICNIYNIYTCSMLFLVTQIWPRVWIQVSRIAGRFFTVWVPGKAKNTGEGSLSLLQGIFLTQESNWGFLHCQQILYQLGWATREAQIYTYVYIYGYTHTPSHTISRRCILIYTHTMCVVGKPNVLQSMGWGRKELDTTERLNNINIHTHILFRFFFPLEVITKYWIWFPMLYSGTLLFYSMYSGVIC